MTPPLIDAEGLSYAYGELRVADASLKFVVDLSAWRIADYERQWRDAIDRLVRGARSTALMTSYRGPGDRPHRMWALWRDENFVYFQDHIVVPADLDAPFDPSFPDVHVGARLAPEQGSPIPEWRIELVHLLATAFGIRWPLYPH